MNGVSVGAAVDWPVARSIAGLKFRIIRHTPQAIFGMALGLLLGGFFAVGSIAAILASAQSEQRGSILTVGGAVLLCLWLLAPLVLGGGELILDLRTLAVYPISLRTLVAGLTLAAIIGIPFLVTLVVVVSTISHASGLLSGLILAVGSVQLAVTAVLAGRMSVGIVSLLTSSRFRSIAGAITVMAAVTLGVSAQFLSLALGSIDPAWLANVRRIVRLLPIGWTPEALASASLGNLAPALFFLVLGMTVPVACLIVWRLVLHRFLGGNVAQNRVKPDRPLIPSWMDRLVDRQTAAVWAKSIRAIRRDAREWTEIAAFLPLILAFSLPAITQLQTREPFLVLAPFLAAVSGATMVTTNLFGGDGPRFTADAFPGENLRPVLVGKLLPRVILVAVIVYIGTAILASVTRGWHFAPVSAMLIVQSLLLGAAAGVFVSLRSPIPLPEKIGGFNAANSGCIAPLFQIAGLLVADIVAVLFAAPALVLTLAVSPLVGLLPTLVTIPLVWWLVNLRLTTEARFARQRIPEIASALTKRQ